METLFFKEYTKYPNNWGFKESVDTIDYFEIEKNMVKFKFCGFLNLNNYLICVFPKGFNMIGKSATVLREDAKLLIRVLNKYNHMSIKSSFVNETGAEKDNNYISTAYELAKDYLQKDLIIQTFKTSKINGPGKTNWGKTIKKTLPIVTKNSFVYIDLVNEKNLKSVSSEIQEVHWLILKDIEDKIGWLINFKVKPISTKVKSLNILYAKNILKKTMRTTFNQNLLYRLNLLYRYLSENFYGSSINNTTFKIFFTFKFEMVWENICKVIYDDMPKLHESVPKYVWEYEGKELKTSNIIPDILTYLKDDALAILDAKYYPELGESSGESKLPPSGDISKQFIYRKSISFNPLFIQKEIFNVFILPGSVKNTIFTREIGRVGFENAKLKHDLHYIYAFQVDMEQAMMEYLESSLDLKEVLYNLLKSTPNSETLKME